MIPRSSKPRRIAAEVSADTGIGDGIGLIRCTSTSPDPDPDVVASGLAGLKYDLTNEQFVYNWPTQKPWKGTCRRLIIGLVGNGVLPYADFQFK